MESRTVQKPRVRRRAAAKDVVGTNFAEKVRPEWRGYYDRLIQARNLLKRRKRTQIRSANQQNLRYSQHMADAGTNSYEKDLLLSSVSSAQDALFEIGAALDRIEEGTYGICEATGKPIEPERLNAIPWTRFSARAERQLEKEGQIKKAKIPPPQRIGRAPTLNSVGETWEREPQPKKDKPERTTRKR